MRFLNKVVFINSATIRYAEVMVNGNVHLIGTQGVGKSTLLRAVLFFYNADTLKLGISKEKKSFAEYYFPAQLPHTFPARLLAAAPFPDGCHHRQVYACLVIYRLGLHLLSSD